MITREKIKRLEREIEKLDPDKDRLRFCWLDGVDFYCNKNKKHKQMTINVSKTILQQNDFDLKKGFKQTTI